MLFATSIGSYAHAMTLESALAAALTFRGAEVHVLLCDGAMTACAECEASLYPSIAKFVTHGPSRDLCGDCVWPAERVYARLGLKVHRYSEWLTAEDRATARRIASTIPFEQIKSFTLDNLAIGEHAHAGALRFFATGSLEGETAAAPVLRRYLESALLTAYATRRLIRTVGFESAVFTHGIYVPWGIVGEVARSEGVHVVDLERRVPEAAIHLQPRRHVSPHAHERAARSLGGRGADAVTGPRADEVPVQSSRGVVRLDRVPPAAAAGCGRHRTGDSGSIARRRSSAC